MKSKLPFAIALLLLAGSPMHAQSTPAALEWVDMGGFRIARTETTVGQFRRYVEATGARTFAERAGGQVYESGWVRKNGWTWRTPFGAGRPAHDAEPTVQVTYDEAQAFCRWAGGRLPLDAEWKLAAYVERGPGASGGFTPGRTYLYPTGDVPANAQCLGDCGPQAQARAIRHGASLSRGYGHARVDSTPAGVNGLQDMGGNVWEWIDEPPGLSGDSERATRGGSWWYGAEQMRADHVQHKPGHMAAVYIGFRCAADR